MSMFMVIWMIIFMIGMMAVSVFMSLFCIWLLLRAFIKDEGFGFFDFVSWIRG